MGSGREPTSLQPVGKDASWTPIALAREVGRGTGGALHLQEDQAPLSVTAAARRLGGHAKDIGDFEFADEMAALALCIESHAREYHQ